MVLLSVSAHDIDIAGLALDAKLPVAWLNEEMSDTDVRATGEGQVQVRFSRTGDEIIVRGRVHAPLATPCARCLQPARVDVETELSLLLRPAPHAPPPPKAGSSHRADATAGHDGTASGPKPRGASGAHKHAPAKEPEYEFTSEEADTDVYDGETVVLDSFVREALLLEIPNFPLCSELCPGIAPPPADSAPEEPKAAIDPRLQPLSALRARLEGKAEGPSNLAGGARPPGGPPESGPRPPCGPESGPRQANLSTTKTKKNKE